jgi:hypothetical protein
MKHIVNCAVRWAMPPCDKNPVSGVMPFYGNCAREHVLTAAVAGLRGRGKTVSLTTHPKVREHENRSRGEGKILLNKCGDSETVNELL